MSEIKNITRENLPNFLAVFIEQNKLEVGNVSKAIGCSIPVIRRIIGGKTFASDEMIKQCGVMISIGFEKYSKLSDADKEKISETLGTLGGGILGFGSITAAVSASGAVVGLSAAGITSGLAAIGSIVGGGMVAGIISVAAIPIAAGALGYGLIKGIKSLISDNKLNNEDFDPKWEIKR